MWTIRQEQVEAFRDKALQKFEDEMVEHSQRYVSRLFQAAGERGVRQAVRLGSGALRHIPFEKSRRFVSILT